jgi:predicted nucleic acid-binding protein
MPARRVTPPEAPTLYVAEPPAAYGRRPLLVVDASVIAAALFGEERHSIAVAMLLIRSLAAPQLVDYEIANVALKKRRLGQIDAEDVAGALADFLALDLARHPVDVAATLALAERYKLSAYDAAYLWLAETLATPLATFDDKLAAVARKHLPGGASPPNFDSDFR